MSREDKSFRFVSSILVVVLVLVVVVVVFGVVIVSSYLFLFFDFPSIAELSFARDLAFPHPTSAKPCPLVQENLSQQYQAKSLQFFRLVLVSRS
jgi:hypothetical protein